MVDKNKKLQKKLEDILPDSVKDREGKAAWSGFSYSWTHFKAFKSKNCCLKVQFSFCRIIRKIRRQGQRWIAEHHEWTREIEVVPKQRRTSTLWGKRAHFRSSREGISIWLMMIMTFIPHDYGFYDTETRDGSWELESEVRECGT